jgi:hypothetical protein
VVEYIASNVSVSTSSSSAKFSWRSLAHEHGVDACVVERDSLGCARQYGADVDECAHPVVGLYGDDRGEAAHELSSQSPGSRTEVEDVRVRVELESLLSPVE